MSVREPDAILAELGTSLHRAWRRPPLRARVLRGLRISRRATVAALATLAVVPTAVATRDAIWAPDPASIPASLRPPDAVAPQRAGSQVYVAAGTADGVRWRLSAAACDYGSVRVVGLFLDVPGGGAGSRCDIATARPGAGASPSTLARRLVQTYYDPASGRTWIFGALPAAAATVEIQTPAGRTEVPAAPADARAIVKGGLPDGLRIFVAVVGGANAVPLVTVRDEGRSTLLSCHDGRCSEPTSQEAS